MVALERPALQSQIKGGQRSADISAYKAHRKIKLYNTDLLNSSWETSHASISGHQSLSLRQDPLKEKKKTRAWEKQWEDSLNLFEAAFGKWYQSYFTLSLHYPTPQLPFPAKSVHLPQQCIDNSHSVQYWIFSLILPLLWCWIYTAHCRDRDFFLTSPSLLKPPRSFSSRSVEFREEVKGWKGQDALKISQVYGISLNSLLRKHAASVGVYCSLKVQLKLGFHFRKYLYLSITWWSTTSPWFHSCCHAANPSWSECHCKGDQALPKGIVAFTRKNLSSGLLLTPSLAVWKCWVWVAGKDRLEGTVKSTFKWKELNMTYV